MTIHLACPKCRTEFTFAEELRGQTVRCKTCRTIFVVDGTAGKSRETPTAGFEQRICSAPHSWKALRTVGFRPGHYPGVAKVRGAGQQVCKDAGHAVASDPLSYRWSYQWPTLVQWRGGQTYGVCWAPSP